MGKRENLSPAAAGILDLSVEESEREGRCLTPLIWRLFLHDTPGEGDLQKDQQPFSRGQLYPSGQEYDAPIADQKPPWN